MIILTCIFIYLHKYLLTFMLTYSDAYFRTTYIRIYLHTFLDTYIPHIHAYLNTCKHTSSFHILETMTCTIYLFQQFCSRHVEGGCDSHALVNVKAGWTRSSSLKVVKPSLLEVRFLDSQQIFFESGSPLISILCSSLTGLDDSHCEEAEKTLYHWFVAFRPILSLGSS